MKKEKNKENKAKETPFGEKFGSFLRIIAGIMKVIFKFLWKLINLFGLLPAIVYSLFGVVLYFVFGFNPFDNSLNAKLFLAGFSLTIICAIIIAGKNLFVKPVKNIAKGYKNPVWKKEKEEEKRESENRRYEEHNDKEEAKRSRKKKNKKREDAEEYAENCSYSYSTDVYKGFRAEYNEQPQIYYSKREENTIIHEYHDRFEVFRLLGGRKVLDKIEFKNDED